MALTPLAAAALELGARALPAALALGRSTEEKQAAKAYRDLLGYDPTKEFQKEQAGQKQRILSAAEAAKAQLGRGGAEGGRKTEALGKLYKATFGAMAKGESELRDKLWRENLERYGLAAKGLSDLGAMRQAAKAEAARSLSEIDTTDIEESVARFGTARAAQKDEIRTPQGRG